MAHCLVISDIHLGDQRFTNVSSLYDLLLTEPYSRLILVGDILDLWLSTLDELLKNEFLQLLQKLSETKDIIYVIGNHDADIINLSYLFPHISFVEFYRMEDAGKRFLFLHGHQVYHKRDASWFVKMTAKVNYWVWRHFGVDIQNISNNRKSYTKYINMKRKHIMKRFGKDVDVIVFGHTHKIGHIISGKVELFNLGAWIRDGSYAMITNGIVKMGVKNG